MNGLNYLLQTNLYLLLFMGFYVLVLKKETFFRQNRFYLNTSIFLSFLIPFVNSEWFRDLFITQQVRETAIMPTQMMYETIIVGVNQEASTLSVSDAMFWTYTSVVNFLLLRFVVRLLFLKSKLKVEKGTAFSFFNTLVVDPEIPKAETIIDHEKVHMRQWHSADIIFIELAAIINWFNPVMYIYKKEIRHIHEFIADEEAASLMESKSEYALLLFSNTLGVDPLHLSNNFFNKSLLKRRILMLNKNKSRRTGLWKYGFSAPLFILMLIVSAAAVKSEEGRIKPVAEALLSPLGSETSKKIISGLEFNNTTPQLEENTTTRPVATLSNETNTSSTEQDYTGLRRHFQINMKYPPSARQNNITGLVLANFMIKNKKVTSIMIEKGVQMDLDDEVIRTLTLYKDDIDVPDDKYSIAVSFHLLGSDAQPEPVPYVGGKNFTIQIRVTGYLPEANLKEDFTPGTSPNNSQQLKEVVIGSDDMVKDFASVEVLPEFPGGMEGWGKYLSENLKYPEPARKENITGRVIMSFIVEKNGSLTDIKVLRGIGGGADEEAIRVLKAAPKWKPGVSDGLPVRVAYTMPILFQRDSK